MKLRHVDGAIINICHGKGIDKEQAFDLLKELARLQPRKVVPRAQYLYPLEEVSPGMKMARTAIKRMEKVIARVVAGQHHGISRKKWRRFPEEMAVIMTIFCHVISRPKPTDPQDILADAQALLIKTGMMHVTGSEISEAQKTWQGKLSLALQLSNENMHISNLTSDALGMKSLAAGQLQLTIKTPIPEVVFSKIKRMAGSMEPVSDIVDWPGFQGPMQTIVKNVGKLERTDMETHVLISIKTGIVSIDDNGELTVTQASAMR